MNSQLQNIPSIWTALTHWLAYMIYIGFLPKRIRGGYFAAASLGLLGVQCVYHGLICNLTGMEFNAAMIVFALLTLMPFLLLCRLRWENAVYYCARAFIWGAFAVSLAWQLYVYYAQRLPAMEGTLGQVVFMVLVCGGIIFGMYMLERGRKKEIREMRVTPVAAGAAVLMAFIIYILSSLSFSSIESPFGGETYAEAFNIRSLVYLGGVAILYAIHLQLCDTHIRQELDALQGVLNMQYTNYCLSQESVDLVNRKYHDLKHQIQVLRAEIGTEQKLDCLDQMEQEIRAYEALNQTGNKVLDTILTSKSVFCQNHDIRFTCVVDGQALDFMGVMELSTLFGNALDNAIESVSKISDPEQRLVHLSVARQKGFVRIRVENRCDEDLVVGKELPGTTKQDKRNHGYGLKSIRATAEKYGGSATVRAENGWFELRILIPVTEGDRGE